MAWALVAAFVAQEGALSLSFNPLLRSSFGKGKKEEDDAQRWLRLVKNIDDVVVYNWFRRQFDFLAPGFDPKKQLTVSVRLFFEAGLRKFP